MGDFGRRSRLEHSKGRTAGPALLAWDLVSDAPGASLSTYWLSRSLLRKTQKM